MELLKRYLQAVAEHLPAHGRQDTLAELKANLESEIEGREEELGRNLTETEIAAVLEAHGMPVLIASRYGSQHFLIGPSLFPVYWYTLKRSFPLVVLAYTVVQMVDIFFNSGSGAELGHRIGAALGHFPAVAPTFWGIMTLGFALFEYGQGSLFPRMTLPKWSVRDLPPLERTERKKHSFANGIADLIVSILMVGWLLAVPNHPFLIIGPGVKILHNTPFGLTPEWHVFYWQFLGLLIAMLPSRQRCSSLLAARTRMAAVGRQGAGNPDSGHHGAGANLLRIRQQCHGGEHALAPGHQQWNHLGFKVAPRNLRDQVHLGPVAADLHRTASTRRLRSRPLIDR